MTDLTDDFTPEELAQPDVNPAELMREQAREEYSKWLWEDSRTRMMATREDSYVAGYTGGFSKGHSMGFTGGSAFTRVYALSEIKQLRARMDSVTALSWVGLPEEVIALLKHIPRLLDVAESKSERLRRTEQRVSESDRAEP